MPRKKERASEQLLLEVAKLRFERKYKNQEVAARLGIGTKQVARLLEDSVQWLVAEKERLARMERVGTAQDRLEEELKRKFLHLKAVNIVPSRIIKKEEDYAALILDWAVTAADHFDRLVNSGELRDKADILHVAMSGGETILEMINALPERPRRNVHYYAAAFLGRSRASKSHVDPATNATVAWARSGRLPGHFIFATMSPSDVSFDKNTALSKRKTVIVKHLREMADSYPVQDVMEDLDEVRVAFPGLGMVNRPKGALRSYEPSATGLLTELVTPQELAEDKAIGDIGYCFFDKDGNGRDDWQFFLTAGYYSDTKGVEFYRRMVRERKQVIVMAGPFKLPAILAALKGQLFNVWITDEDSARHVLAGSLGT